MPKHYQGSYVGSGLRFGIVVSRFNEVITRKLLEGAQDTLLRHGVKENDIHITWVPGAFEIPQAAKKLAQSGSVQAIICLGCVIRGGTPHFEHIARECIGGIAAAARETMVPMALGVLTTENMEQAIERAGGKMGNKGFQAAMSALEMANLWRGSEGL